MNNQKPPYNKSFLYRESTQGNVTSRVEKVQEEVNKAHQEMAEMKKTIEQITERSYAVATIFISAISFLITEVQLLKNLNNIFEIISFSCILFSLLLGFNFALYILIKNDRNIDFVKWFIIAIFIIGLLFSMFGK